MIDTDTPTVRVSAHADCDHPRTKAARAACRRARARAWVEVTRDDVSKGDTVRVHTDEDVIEGMLLGWGKARMIVRVGEGEDAERVTVSASMIDRVETAGA